MLRRRLSSSAAARDDASCSSVTSGRIPCGRTPSIPLGGVVTGVFS